MTAVTPDAIRIHCARSQPLKISPRQFELNAAAFGLPNGAQSGLFRIVAEDGWAVEPVGHLCWRLTAFEIDIDRPLSISLQRILPAGRSEEWLFLVPVQLDLTSTFDPVEHTFPEPNRAAVLGDILPERRLFALTYIQPPGLLANALFNGLYSGIVFLRRDGPTRGGLCSGMARWAVARGLGAEPQPESREHALERIVVYHGRQLCDRAFARGVRWFLRGSPRASYRVLRRELLQHGTTDRAFDIGVPKPWRRDVVSALVTQGHTVVPYRIRQDSGERAFVEVYDPNRPPSTLETPESIEFDLRRDRYSYRHMVSMDQTNVGIIAARQSGYAGQGTAILAGLVSLGMKVGKRLRPER
ncbi:hypothetical protein BH20CHL1_BH20CHL1_00620 [soil metagenome]